MKTKYSEHSLKSFGSIVKIAISVVFFVTVYFLTAKSALYQDFQVYYSAGSSVNPFISYDYSLYDQDLTVGTVRTYGLVEYVFSHSGLHLPFTYPPFAALLFLPISAFPYSIAAFIHACVYGACAIAVAYLAACMLSKHEWFTRRINIMTPWWVMMIAAIFVVTSAWRGGTNYGQINPIIFLLVLWDFVRPTHRIPRGFFVGIAAGIKLTPLALMLVFLARRLLSGALHAGEFGDASWLVFLARRRLPGRLLARAALADWPTVPVYQGLSILAQHELPQVIAWVVGVGRR